MLKRVATQCGLKIVEDETGVEVKWTEAFSAVWSAGYRAAGRGEQESFNPFAENTPERLCWEAGHKHWHIVIVEDADKPKRYRFNANAALRFLKKKHPLWRVPGKPLVVIATNRDLLRLQKDGIVFEATEDPGKGFHIATADATKAFLAVL